MVIAVSANLNVSEEDFTDIPGSMFFFKNRINPREVIGRFDKVGQDASQAT